MGGRSFDRFCSKSGRAGKLFGRCCSERLAAQRCVCGSGARAVEPEGDVMRRAGARSAF